MSIKVALEHRTSYTFDKLVQVYPHVVRLRPAPHSRTPIEAYSLRVEPTEHFVNWQQDALGNFMARLVFPKPMQHLTITVGLIADLKVINPFDFFIEEWAETWPAEGLTYPKALADDLKPYLRPVDETGEESGPGDLVRAWVANFSVPEGTRTIDFLVAINHAVNADVGYSVRMEPGVQTPDFALRTGIGSCRDSAWLLVSILRQFGLAARFVSGYLVQLASDIEALDGPSGPTADFTDLHAWTEVYIPGAGWIGLDPTSGLFAGEGHIPLAATPHPASAAPISGGTGVCNTVLEFSNTVTRVHEDPRVTLPYTDEAWQTICDVGRRVDERLAAGDVRLTMGGEPTFVSVDNQTDKEWRTAADGPHKRSRASDLAARLKARWAPEGLVQRSQRHCPLRRLIGRAPPDPRDRGRPPPLRGHLQRLPGAPAGHDNPDIHVGGVRFKAWQPPSALHPTFSADGPLQFELIDLTAGTSRGGCTYHVTHPGGLAYDEPPVNAVTAESRRARRFEATGFTPGKLDLSDIREKQARMFTDIGAPGILDLRRVRTVQQ